MPVLKKQAGSNEQSLRDVVKTIQEETSWLLEIVNLNMENQQYICTGDITPPLATPSLQSSTYPFLSSAPWTLDTLISVTNHRQKSPSSPLLALIRTSAATTASTPQPITLARAVAAVPLHGIDVPFYSTFLRSGVRPSCNLLLQFIKRENVDPKQLIGSYTPNLKRMPFESLRAYFEEVGRLTGSEEIERVLGRVSGLLRRPMYCGRS